MRCKVNLIEDPNQVSSTRGMMSSKPSTSTDTPCVNRRITASKPSNFVRRFGDKQLPKQLEDMQGITRSVKNKPLLRRKANMKLRSDYQGQNRFNKAFLKLHDFKKGEKIITSSSKDNVNEGQQFMEEKFHQSDPKDSKNITSKHTIGNQELRKEGIFERDSRTFYIKVHRNKVNVLQPNEGTQKTPNNSDGKDRILENPKNPTYMQSQEELDHPGFVVLENNLNKDDMRDNVGGRQQRIHQECPQPAYQLPFNNQATLPSQIHVLNPDSTFNNFQGQPTVNSTNPISYYPPNALGSVPITMQQTSSSSIPLTYSNYSTLQNLNSMPEHLSSTSEGNVQIPPIPILNLDNDRSPGFKKVLSNSFEASHNREGPSNQNVYGIISPNAQNRHNKQYSDGLRTQSSICQSSPNKVWQTMVPRSCGREIINTHRNSEIPHTNPGTPVMVPVLTYVPQIVYAPYSDMVNYTFPNLEKLTNFPGHQTNMASVQNSILNSSQSYIYLANDAGANLNSHSMSNNQNFLQGSTYVQDNAFPLSEIPSVYCGVPLSSGSSYETPSGNPLASTNIDISANQSSSVVSHTSSASLKTSHFPGCSVTKSSQLSITTSQTNKNSINNIGSSIIGQGLDPLNPPHTLAQTCSYPTNFPEQVCDTGKLSSLSLPGTSGEMLDSLCEIHPTEKESYTIDREINNPTEATSTSKLPEFSVAFTSHLPHEGNLHIKQYKEYQLYNSQKESNNNLIDNVNKSISKTNKLSGIETDELIKVKEVCNEKTIGSVHKQQADIDCNSVTGHLISDILLESSVPVNSVIVPTENTASTTITSNVSVQTEDVSNECVKKMDNFKKGTNISIATLELDNIVGNCRNVREDLITGHNSRNSITDLVLLKPRDIRECLGADESFDISVPLDSFDRINSESDTLRLPDLSSNTILKYHNVNENVKDTKDHDQSVSEISKVECPFDGQMFNNQAINLSKDSRKNDEPIDMTIYGNEPLNMSVNKTKSDEFINKTKDLNVISNLIVTGIESNEMDIEKDDIDLENNEIVRPNSICDTAENLSNIIPMINDSVENKKSQYRNSSSPGALDLSLKDIKPLDMSFKIKKSDNTKVSSDVIDLSKRVKFIYKSVIRKGKTLPSNSEVKVSPSNSKVPDEIDDLVMITQETDPNKDKKSVINVRNKSTEHVCNPKKIELEIISSKNNFELFSSKMYEASNNSDQKDLDKAVNNGTTKSINDIDLLRNKKQEISNKFTDKKDFNKSKDLDSIIREVIPSNGGVDLNSSIIFEKIVTKDKSLDPALDTSIIIIENSDMLSESPVFNRRQFVSRKLNATYIKSPKKEKHDDFENNCNVFGSNDYNADYQKEGTGDEIITELDIRKLSPRPSTSLELTTFRPQDIKISSILSINDKNVTNFDSVEVKQEAIEEELNFATGDDSGFYPECTPEYESEQTKHQLLFKSFDQVDQQRIPNINFKQIELQKQQNVFESEDIKTKEKEQLDQNSSETENIDGLETENVSKQQQNSDDHEQVMYAEQVQKCNDLKNYLQNKTSDFRYLKEVYKTNTKNQQENQDEDVEAKDSMQDIKEHNSNINLSVDEIKQHEACELDTVMQINEQKWISRNETFEESKEASIQIEVHKKDSLVLAKKQNLIHFEKETIEENDQNLDIREYNSAVQIEKIKHSSFNCKTLEDDNKLCEKQKCDPMTETLKHFESQTLVCVTENLQKKDLEHSNFNESKNQHYQHKVHDRLTSFGHEATSGYEVWSPDVVSNQVTGHKEASVQETPQMKQGNKNDLLWSSGHEATFGYELWSPGSKSNQVAEINETFVPETPQMEQRNEDEKRSSCLNLTPKCISDDHKLNLEYSISPVIPLQNRNLKEAYLIEDYRGTDHQFLNSPDLASRRDTVNGIFVKESNCTSTNKINHCNEYIASVPMGSTFLSGVQISLPSKHISKHIKSVSGDPVLVIDPEPILPVDSLSSDNILSDKTNSVILDPVSWSNNFVSSDLTDYRITDKLNSFTENSGIQTHSKLDTNCIREVEFKDRKLRSNKRNRNQAKDFGLNFSSHKRKENMQKNSGQHKLLNDNFIDMDNNKLSKCSLKDDSTTNKNEKSNGVVLDSNEINKQKELIYIIEPKQDLQTGELDKHVFENAEKEEISNMVFENIKSNDIIHTDKCDVTSKDFSQHLFYNSDENIKTSDNKEQLWKCNKCEYKSSREDHIFRHMQSHTRINKDKEPLMFTCELCEIDFADKNELHSHRYNTHIKPGECFNCDICDNDFDTSEELERHMKMHTTEKCFACLKCDSTFTSQTSLNIHKRTHIGDNPLQCPNCKYSCSKKSTFDKHILTHTDQSKLLPCNVCGLNFINIILLKMHMKIHRIRKSFVCPECDFSSLSQDVIQEHIQSHKRKKYFIGTKCNETYADKALLEIHTKTHDTKPEFRCSKCNINFISIDLLSNHLDLLHSNDYKTNFSNTTKPHSDNHNSYYCNSCEFISASNSELQEHILIHSIIKDSNLKNEIDTKQLDCNDNNTRNVDTDSSNSEIMKETSGSCKRKRKSDRIGKRDDKAHELHNKIFMCSKCDFQTVLIDLFTIHKSNHLKENSCTSETENISESSKHVSVNDQSSNLFKCSVCGYEAESDDSLAMHNHIHAVKLNQSSSFHQLNHKNNKAFLCEICGIDAINSEDLSIHELTHRNANPHHCEVCGYGASHRPALIQHMVALHGGKKIFSCNLCSENFTSKTSLKEHLMTHLHGKKRKGSIKSMKNFSKSREGNLEMRNKIKKESQKCMKAKDTIISVNDTNKSILDSLELFSKKTIQCCHCFHYYSTLQSVKEHNRKKHPGKQLSYTKKKK